MLLHHIQRNTVVARLCESQAYEQEMCTVHDRLNFFYCCPTRVLWREKKDHSADQVTQSVKSR